MGRIDLPDVPRDEDVPEQHPLTGRTFETEQGTATVVGQAPWSSQYLIVDIPSLCGDTVLRTTRPTALVRDALRAEA